jgi:hypothetical protein
MLCKNLDLLIAVGALASVLVLLLCFDKVDIVIEALGTVVKIISK